jgi:hypothetical protein
VQESSVTLRVLVKMLAWRRLVQVLPWPLAFALGARFEPPHLWLALLDYGLITGWPLFYGVRALRTGTLPDWLMVLDIAVTCSCLIVSGLGWSTASGSVLGGMAACPAVGVALTTGVMWRRGRAAAAAILIVACYVAGILPELHPGGPVIVTATGTSCRFSASRWWRA